MDFVICFSSTRGIQNGAEALVSNEELIKHDHPSVGICKQRAWQVADNPRGCQK